MRTCMASRSRSEYTATVVTPSSRHVRMTRTAISPRLATRTLWNMAAISLRDARRRRKLAGVLAEPDGGAVVVGIGINVNWPQPMLASLGDAATALNHLAGHDVDRAELLVRLLERLDARLSEGPAATMRDYRDRCATL